MHIYGKDQQAFHLRRTRAEKYMSRINAIIVAMQLACWLTAMIRTAINEKHSMTNALFGTSNLELTAPYMVEGCMFNAIRTHAFFDRVEYVLSPLNVEYFVSRSVMNMRYLFALTGVYTMVSIVNRIFFETNTFELRYHFCIFRKDTLTTWETLLGVLGIVVAFGVSKENQILQDYLAYCSNKDNSGPLIPVSANFYNSIPPYVELYVMYFVSLGYFAINLIIAVWNLSKENPRDKLMREDKIRRQELLKQYQMPPYYGGQAGTQPPPTVPQQQQQVTGGNVAPIGGAASPPPLGRFQGASPPPPPLQQLQQQLSQSPGSLYANHLPSRPRTNGSRSPQQPQEQQLHQQQQQQHRPQPDDGLNNDGGRYDIREVYDNDDDEDFADIDLDPTNPNSIDYSVDGPPGGYMSSSNNNHRVSGDQQNFGEPPPPPPPPPQLQHRGPPPASGLSTPLVGSRQGAIPPPPPVASGLRTGSSKMLAPPSPLNNGGDTTTDTVRMQP